jgi:hypothetical protein
MYICTVKLTLLGKLKDRSVTEYSEFKVVGRAAVEYIGSTYI